MYDMPPKLGRYRVPLYTFNQGSTVIIPVVLKSPYTDKPITAENTRATVTLIDQRYSRNYLWVGSFNSGLKLKNKGTGYSEVRIPKRISDKLRRGSYMLGIMLEDKQLNWVYNLDPIYFEIEYVATSPTRDVPYS